MRLSEDLSVRPHSSEMPPDHRRPVLGRFAAATVSLGLLLVAGPALANDPIFKGFEDKSFTSSGGKTLRYRFFTPANYDSSKKYPLITFLHGVGEVGGDNLAQVTAGNPNGAVVWTL